MGFYRFMSTNHIGDALDGKLRFRHFSYYRFLEILLGDEDDLIGDVEDGVSFVQTGKLEYKEDVPAEMVSKLQKLGVDVAGARNVVMDDCTFISAAEGFLLCFSRGELESLKKSMVNDDYDACIEFVGLDELAQYIYSHGVVDGRGPVSDFFEPPLVDDVVYDNNRVLIEEMKEHRANPFLKREKFKEQEESRIVLLPKQQFEGDLLCISVAFPEGYLTEKFRGQPKKNAKSEGMPDPVGYLGEVLEALMSLESDLSSDIRKNPDQIEAIVEKCSQRKRDWLNAEGRRKKIAQAYWQLRSDVRYIDRSFESYLCSVPSWDHLVSQLRMFFVKHQL